MISIMTPTRGRQQQFSRMCESARDTAMLDVQIIAFMDCDDPSLAPGADFVVRGPRSVIHSARWDKCLTFAKGNLLFHANDDIIFRTKYWDAMIEDFFYASNDKIWMVHGDDLGPKADARDGCHPCVHRKWVETLGYFIPPYFDGEWGDTWVNDLADRIGRDMRLPFITEHMHRIFGKAEIDQTTRDYLARQERQNPARIYREREAERVADAEKLRRAIREVSDSNLDAEIQGRVS